MNAVAAFVAAVEHDLAGPAHAMLSDDDLAAAMTAAVRLYGARAEGAAAPRPPLQLGPDLSTTAVLTAACEMIRQTNVNMFDVSLWFSRGAG